MAYRIELTKTSAKEIRELPGHIRQRARRLVDGLAENPRPAGSQELRDLPGRYRVRLDRWRIIYRVDYDAELVTLLRVRLKTGPETYEALED